MFSHNNKGDNMKFRLGYVNGPFSLPFTYCHTLTYTNFKKMKKEEAYKKLENIIKENLNNLEKVLKFNKNNNISFYRISPTIIPLATLDDVTFDYITPFKKKWKKIGEYITKNNMRIDIHLNQYCILNSMNKEVINNCIKELEYNYSIFKLMGINGMIILHIGSSTNGKEESINRFKENFSKLKPEIKKIITLENDDKIYNIIDTLTLCEELNIPMTLDYHHYLCNNNKEKLKDYLPRIIKTWKNNQFNPKMHFSSPKNKKEKRSHSDFIEYKQFINFINKIKDFNQDIDIMLECKAKEEALFRLSRQLKYTKNIKHINKSTFKTK